MEALNLFCYLQLEPDELTIAEIGSPQDYTQLGSVKHGKKIHVNVLQFWSHKHPVLCSGFLHMHSNYGRSDLASQVVRVHGLTGPLLLRTRSFQHTDIAVTKRKHENFKNLCQPRANLTSLTSTSHLSACTPLVNGTRWAKSLLSHVSGFWGQHISERRV